MQFLVGLAQSGAKTDLQTVIVKCARELVVGFWLQVHSYLVWGGLRAEHLGQVTLHSVDLVLVQSVACLAWDVMVGVDESLRFLELLENWIVYCADVTSFKSFLGRAVAEKQVRLSPNLHINKRFVVVFVLLVIL